MQSEAGRSAPRPGLISCCSRDGDTHLLRVRRTTALLDADVLQLPVHLLHVEPLGLRVRPHQVVKHRRLSHSLLEGLALLLPLSRALVGALRPRLLRVNRQGITLGVPHARHLVLQHLSLTQVQLGKLLSLGPRWRLARL